MVIFPQQYCFSNPQIIYHIPQYLHIVCEISLDVPDVTIDGICMGKKKQIKNGRRNYPNGWGNGEPDIPVHDWPSAGLMPVDARPRQTSPSGGLLCLRPSSLNVVFAQQICLRTPLIGGHDRHQLAAYLVRVPHQVAPCRLLSWRVVGVGDHNHPMLGWCWASVADAVPTLSQHWGIVTCFLADCCFFQRDCISKIMCRGMAPTQHYTWSPGQGVGSHPLARVINGGALLTLDLTVTLIDPDRRRLSRRLWGEHGRRAVDYVSTRFWTPLMRPH